MELDQPLPRHLSLANEITDAAVGKEDSFADVFNALTITVGAIAVDYAVDEAGNIDQEKLDNTILALGDQIAKAAHFAAEQVRNNPAIIEIYLP